jgi:radical SAM superfamily enzyme YgiQ (UPF0313 family)
MQGRASSMTVHLVNPSDFAFGVAVITPRWLYVLAAATPRSFGDPKVVDESLQFFDESQVQSGDVVGIGIHTLNARRGYEIGRMARARGAFVVYGGIHAGLYPQEPHDLGGAHAVVKGDGDVVWASVLADCTNGGPRPFYDAGRIEPDQFLPGRWDLLPANRYMWASVQTVRGCPKHCSFCSVWRTDGQWPRQRSAEKIIEEMVTLRRMGFRFIALADDNFYPVTLEDLSLAERRDDKRRFEELKRIREDRFRLMHLMSRLPKDMSFFTQITMEASEDPEFLDAMHEARIQGALVGVESVTPEGLKSIYKNFNSAGGELVDRLRIFKKHQVHVLGSFIFGLESDTESTFRATADLAQQAEIAFAQFVMIIPFPGTVDFKQWERKTRDDPTRIAGQPLSRYWLIPQVQRPKVYVPHPRMSQEEIRVRTQWVWDQFYSLPAIWKRSSVAHSLRARLAFVLLSKLYRQMYANTGIATDSARTKRANKWARWIAWPAQKLFLGAPMPELRLPAPEI